MANLDHFLDEEGLSRVWGKAKNKFVAKESISQSVSEDTGSAVKVPSVAAVEGAISAAATPLSTDIAADSASDAKAATPKAVADYAFAKSNVSQSTTTDTGSAAKVPSVAAVEQAITAAQTPISQSISTDTGSTTKVPSVAAVEGAINSALSTVYKYKGSVQTEAELPTTNVANGDVYNIVARSTYGEAGMNVAAIVDGSTLSWDPLGGNFEIQAMTDDEIDAICT